jgi:hypothetical protein
MDFVQRTAHGVSLFVISVFVFFFLVTTSRKVVSADVPLPPVVINTISLGEFHRLVTIKLETAVNSMMCFTILPNPSKPVCWAQAREMVVSTGTEIRDMVVVYSAVVDLAGRPDVLCMIQVVNGNNGDSSITCAAAV